MNINPEYFDALKEIASIKFAYDNGKELPLVARKFIEMGEERGIKIEVKYGTEERASNTHAGYWIHAPEKNKNIFQDDVLMDDESPDNLIKAVEWMNKKLDELTQ